MSLLSGDSHEMWCGFVEVQSVSCSLLLNPLHSWLVLCPSQPCATVLDFPRRCHKKVVQVRLTPPFFPVMVHEMTDLQV